MNGQSPMTLSCLPFALRPSKDKIYFKERDMKRSVTSVLAISLAMFFLGCSEPLTTREKGAGIGTLTGAGLGAIIGSATGNAGAGAGIGAAVGLIGGALIGDQMQARQKQDQAVQQQLSAQQAEIQRQNQELQQLKQQQQR
jgi:phage tail tape-measure protein